MTAQLKDRIKLKMREKRLNIAELEKLAGLKRSSVGNFLQGRTKQPKIDTLQALAEVLECSVTELIGVEEPHRLSKEETSPLLEHVHLLLESMKEFIFHFENEEASQFTLNEALEIVKETYLYSLHEVTPIVKTGNDDS